MSKARHLGEKLRLTWRDVLRTVFGTLPTTVNELVLVVLLVALCLQNMVLLETPVGTVRPYHIVGALAFLYVLVSAARRHERVILPPAMLTAAVTAFTAVSLYNMPEYGLDTITLNYVFLVVVAITIQNLIGDARLYFRAG